MTESTWNLIMLVTILCFGGVLFTAVCMFLANVFAIMDGDDW